MTLADFIRNTVARHIQPQQRVQFSLLDLLMVMFVLGLQLTALSLLVPDERGLLVFWTVVSVFGIWLSFRFSSVLGSEHLFERLLLLLIAQAMIVVAFGLLPLWIPIAICYALLRLIRYE